MNHEGTKSTKKSHEEKIKKEIGSFFVLFLSRFLITRPGIGSL